MKRVLVVATLLLFLVGCAGIQEKWNVLTPDQKARIIVADFQGQLGNLFDQGKAYVTSNPSKQDVWKSKVIPAFDVANKSLASVIVLGKTKPLTPDLVYATVQANVTNVINLLIQLGAIK